MRKSGETKTRSLPVGWVLKLSTSLGVLGLVLWWLPTHEVWAAIKSIPVALWGSILAAFLAGHVVSAVKWWLLTARNADIPLPSAIKAHFAGLTANLFLPSVAGGDVVRAGLVFRTADSKMRVAAGSVTDRLLDSFVLLILSTLGALFVVDDRAWSAGPLLKIGAFFAVLLASILLMALILPKLPRIGPVEKVAMAMREAKQHPGTLALCFGLSALIQSVFISLNFILALASGVTVSSAAWFFAWPLAKLLAVVPITIAGLGVREAGLAGLLTPFGASAAKVVAAGLLWQTILFSGGLIGGLVLVILRRAAPGAAEPAAADTEQARSGGNGLTPPRWSEEDRL